MMKIINRSEAKTQGLVRYYTGNKCKHGHVAERHTIDGQCIECGKAKAARQYIKNREKRMAQHAEWVKNNKDHVLQYAKEYARSDKGRESAARYRRNNKKAVLKRCAQWREKNPEKIADYTAKNLDKMIAYTKEWRSKNPEQYAKWKKDYYSRPEVKAAAYCRWAERHAKKLGATPVWADMNLIAGVYRRAKAMRNKGYDVHVDHMVPLQGKHVCGLHVDYNLQIIPAAENVAKGNKLIEGII